ncbi:MAG: fibronectin type III domain-containing protein [Paludibacter sp.]
MKKITLFFAFMLLAVMANAQVLLDETFETGFPFGAANTTTGPTNGWTTTNLAFVGTISRTVSAASVLTYPASGTKWINSGVGNGLFNNYGATGSSQALSWKSFTASPVTSGNVFLSFLYKCTAKGGSNSPVMSISDINSTGNGAIVWCAGDATNVRLGVTRSSTTAADAQYAGTAGGAGSLVINTVYLVVLKYNIDNSTAYLYINPTVGGAEPTYQAYDDGNFGTKLAARPASFQYLKIYNTGSSKSYFIASGARVSRTWNDAVAPFVSALPKISAPNTVSDASAVAPTTFLASWTACNNTASGYNINVYQNGSLVKSQVASPAAYTTTSTTVTGLTPNTTYTYKVQAIASDQVNNANSLETAAINSFTTPAYTVCSTPDISAGATNVFAESFTARWTQVTGVNSNVGGSYYGYVVKVYNSVPTLVKTINIVNYVNNPTPDHWHITGLAPNTTYTYTVTAKGDLVTYSDSPESDKSGSVTTLASYPASLNPNFGNGTWETVQSSTLGLGSAPVFAANGWDLIHAYVKTNSVAGPKGEVHPNILILDKTSNSGVIYTPTIAAVEEIEIHSSATAGRQYLLEVTTDGGTSYLPVGNGNTGVPGTYYNNNANLEQIDIIPTGSLTNAKFRITDPSSGNYSFYQISTRMTHPTNLTAPTVGSASNVKATTFTACWTPVDANGTNYEVKVYKVITSSTTPGLKTETTTLKATSLTTGGQSTINLGITGLQADSTYIFKVKALGDGDVSYSDSYQTVASAQFTMGHQLATPVVGSANVSATGITANWTAVVTNVLSYDIKVYQGTTLVKTVNVADPNATTVNINGLLYATEYTFTVTANGDNTTYFNSAESAKSAPATTDLGTGINKSESVIQLYFSNKELICSETGNIAIYNLQGAKMLEAQAVTKLKTNLASGIYFVKHTTANGQVTNAKVQIK